MTAPFFTTKQVGAIRKLALRGLQTQVSIYRRTIAESTDGTDDTVTYPLVATTLGWFFSTPTPQQQEDTGQLITVNTYRLFLPVGTNILPGDHLSVGGDTYVVSDTTFESTWLPVLRCSLRKRE